MKTYAEKLRSPLWQKKRLECLQRSEWTCDLCGDTENMLQVHHKQYIKGREPWEYEASQLSVLCVPCHERQHKEDDLVKVISFASLDGPMNRSLIACLLSGALELDRQINTKAEQAMYDLGKNIPQLFGEYLYAEFEKEKP